MGKFVSRAGEKLDYGLKHFGLDVTNYVCADFGCSTGGFTDCLLQNGAKKVYSIDTAYGELDYKLRIDPRVVVMERQNALYLDLPEKVDLVVSDVNWTRQKLIVPVGFKFLKDHNFMISLLKPQYETIGQKYKKGSPKDSLIQEVVKKTDEDLKDIGFKILNFVKSPIVGKKGKNIEYILLLAKDTI